MAYAIYTAVRYLVDLLELAIFITVIISWLPVKKDNRFIKLLYQITEPIMSPIRSLLQKSEFTKNLMMDFSPIVALLLLELFKGIVHAITNRF